MKKTKPILLSILLSLLLSGCYPLQKRVSPQEDTNVVSNSTSNIVGITESFIPDVVTSEAVGETVPSITLSPLKWDNQKIKDYFLKGKTITKASEYDSDYLPNEKRYVYDTEDDIRLILEPGRITFDNKALLSEYSYGYIQTFLDNSYCDDLNGELISFSKASATDTVTRVLNDIGINNFGEPEIYAVTAADAKEICKNIDDIVDWTSDDEVYIMKFPLVYGNVSVIQNGVRILGTDKAYDGAFIDAIVSKAGLISLRLFGIASEEFQTNENVTIKISADAALQELQSFYSKIADPSPPKIIGCHLIYFPSDKNGCDCTFVPYWQLDCTVTGDIVGKAKHTEYINAQSGQRYFDTR